MSRRRTAECSTDAHRKLPPRKFAGAELAGDLVEYSVDHAGLLGLDKGVRDIDVFRNHHTAGHILAVLEFVRARAKYRAKDGVDPLQWPALGERLVDERIEFRLVADHAGDDIPEERRFGRQVFVAFDLIPKPMALEFGEDVVDPRACDVHLIERLHRGKPRRPSPIGFPVFAFVLAFGRLLVGRVVVLCHHQIRVSRCLMRSIARAARAASPPLFNSLARARAQASASVLTVMMPLPSGSRLATANSIRAREDSIATISKWMVSPRITQPSAIAAS